MRFLIGLIMLGIGFLLALKPHWIINFTGRIGVADRGLFATFGGSKFLYQALGILLILLSGVVMFADFGF